MENLIRRAWKSLRIASAVIKWNYVNAFIRKRVIV